MLGQLRLALGVLAGLVIAIPGLAQPTAEAVKADETLLTRAGVGTDGGSLVRFFEKRSSRAKDLEQVPGLVRQLGARAFTEREKASEQLVELGVVVLPELRRSLKSAEDREIRRRLEDCIANIERLNDAETVTAAIRLLAQRKPQSGCAALLAFAPLADAEVEDTLLLALLQLGVREKQVDPVLVEGLTAKHQAVRGAAALTVGRWGDADQRKKVAALLADPNVTVRLRAAQGLVGARDREAVRHLIPLLTEAAPEVAQQADDLLRRVADRTAPSQGLGIDGTETARCRQAWEKWWKDNEGRIDLARADVDIPLANGTRRAREAADRFMVAIFKGDTEQALKGVGVPFSFEHELIERREQLDKQLREICTYTAQEAVKMQWRQVGAMPARDYLGVANKRTRGLLEKMNPRELHLVFGDVTQRGNPGEQGFVMVRVRGAQVEVVGFCEGKMQPKK